jgi:hypothetical protein
MFRPVEPRAEVPPRDALRLPEISTKFSYLRTCFQSLLRTENHGKGGSATNPNGSPDPTCLAGRSALEVVSAAVREPSLNHGSEEPARPVIDPLLLSLADPLTGIALTDARLVGVNATAAPAVEPAWESALLAEVVRRVAWGGDRRRGVARLELGGSLEGTCITVEGEGREVSVDIALGPGGAVGDFPERLAARLRARNITLRSLDVR